MSIPNFLLISADQQRGDCLGVEGRAINTPHLDRLAGQGTRFGAAITPCVVCQPARASILTGQLPRTHGVHDNGIDLNPETGAKGFAGALAAAGYRTGFFGKAHFSTYHTFAPTGSPECLRSSANFGPDWYGPYMGFEHVEMMLVGHNWFPPEKPPAGQHYERWFHADGQGDAKIKAYWENAGDTKGAAQTWHSKLPMEWHNSTWTADRAIDWLNARDDDPFCAWISFPDPHHPFDCPEPWSRLHDPAEVDLPRHRKRTFEGRPWWHEQVLTAEPEGPKENAETRKAYSRIAEQTDEQLREIIANTYGQIALIDHEVGRILDALETAGLAENTVVIYISDHGDWLGDHGLVLKGPMHYEGLLRVPMLLRGPGVRAGAVTDQPVSTLDLGPTMLEMAGAEALQTQHGRSLVPLLEGDGTRDFALNEWELLPTRTGVALSLRTVRTRTHKMTFDMTSGAGELYDLVNDPDELVNLFDAPEAASIRAELEAMLATRPDDMLPNQTQVGMA
ncbi:MAG: sulfatase-like hydrolase/transferase [Pseudomonadota bacterium]